MIGQVQDTLGHYNYRHLARIMSGVLAIPHSNADCERVFSLVRKTRTEARSSVNNETLESLLIQKITAVHALFSHVARMPDNVPAKAVLYMAWNV